MRVTISNTDTTLTLRDVHLVPSFFTNLISVKRFQSSRVARLIYDGSAWKLIHTPSGTKVASSKNYQGMYALDAHVQKALVNAVMEPVDLWHDQLIRKDMMVPALSVVDDATCGKWVYPMKSKGEAYDRLCEFCNWAENNIGKRVNRVRTDNGLEFGGRTYCALHAGTRTRYRPFSEEQTFQKFTRDIKLEAKRSIQQTADTIMADTPAQTTQEVIGMLVAKALKDNGAKSKRNPPKQKGTSTTSQNKRKPVKTAVNRAAKLTKAAKKDSKRKGTQFDPSDLTSYPDRIIRDRTERGNARIRN
ncbi:hypothetical protein V1504DRAFT_431244 [Lipomyces starkeyi]